MTTSLQHALNSPATPRRRRARTATIAAVLAAPTLGLALVGGPAGAAGVPAFFSGQNTGGGAAVTAPDGSVHTLAARLRSVAGDGTASVLAARVTPSTTAAVLVDGTTHTGRLVALDPTDGDLSWYAGNGAVVVRRDGDFSLVDVATGATTPLAAVPAPSRGTREVTAAAATAGGALVATADVSPSGTSGTVYSAHVWLLTADGAQDLASVDGQYIPALAARSGAVDAVLASLADDSLSLLHLEGGQSTRTPIGLAVTPDVLAADLAYATGDSGLQPVLTLTRWTRTTTYDLSGTQLRRYDAGSRIFVSAGDMTDPTSVSNRLTKVVTLTGLPDDDVVAYGTKVTPTVAASVTGVVDAGDAPAVLTVATDKRTTTGVSGKRIPVTRNVCFTASSPGTLYTEDAAPVTDCVQVAHRLELDGFNPHSNKVVIETSSDELRVQVLNRYQEWVTVRVVDSEDGEAKFKIPDGRVRILAPATSSNAANRLLIVNR